MRNPVFSEMKKSASRGIRAAVDLLVSVYLVLGKDDAGCDCAMFIYAFYHSQLQHGANETVYYQPLL